MSLLSPTWAFSSLPLCSGTLWRGLWDDGAGLHPVQSSQGLFGLLAAVRKGMQGVSCAPWTCLLGATQLLVGAGH